MARLVAALFLVVVAAPARASAPALAVQAALADARRLPKAQAKECRWLSLYGVPVKLRAEFLLVLSFHCNSLSREAEIVRPVLVAPDLVRISLLDYGIDPKVWDRLAEHDPYFHARLVKQVVAIGVEEEVEVGHWRRKTTGEIVEPAFARANLGQVYWEKTGTQKRAVKQEAKKQETITSAAPWLPAPDSAALILLAGSEVPIVRADWFVTWTAIQAGRKGSGYYDFLGFKTRKDAEDLAGLDRAAARRLRKEIAAIVSESGVAINARGILREQALTGGFWRSLDANTTVARQNPISFLDEADHDAEEIYGCLPNSLFFYVASDARGVLQDTVPDTIASDHVSTSNDRRIHAGLISCTRCHTNGLQPIDDWARSVYQGPDNPGSPIVLAAVDYKKLKRLRQLYLSPLKMRLKKDVQEFADALLLTNGLTPEKNAAAYASEWHRYGETSLSMEDVALELGVSKEKWAAALKAYVLPGGTPVIADPVLVGLLAGRKARREHMDERVALMYQILSQYKGKE